MRSVIALVLGGGRGTRLYPLTKYRSKPAVPLAAKYRLIDIPLSNCLNSGINQIYVLTQFMSVSLHRHIRRTYYFDPFGGGFVEVLAAQQTLDRNDWYQGTADAVRQQLRYVRESDADYVLILSGDQLYRMDFREMLDTHRNSHADVTIAALPVHRQHASGLGILRADDSGRVASFLEKPKSDAEIDLVRTDPAWIDARGLKSQGRECLASMGIYLFNRKTLIEILDMTDYRDFGKEIFPTSIRTRHVQTYLFDGYWEDIGTIAAFYEASLALAQQNPPFQLDCPEAPIYSRARFLPPSRFDGATVRGSLIADGCTIGEGAEIVNSVIGLRSRIGKNCKIRNSIIMGSDYYESDKSLREVESSGRPLLGIGENCMIDKAIVDKNCRIGNGCQIVSENRAMDGDEQQGWQIRDGILVVIKGAEMANGTTMG